MHSDNIVKPIFIVGLPRSGTTLFYKKLGLHPDLAFLTKTSKKFPRSVIMSRLISPFRKDHRPTEASWIWSQFARDENDVMDLSDINASSTSYYRKVFSTQMRLFGKSRFICKYPRNVLRMEYFESMFPDAVFLHLVRDGRAVANSILECRRKHGGEGAYWGIKPPGWRDLLSMDGIQACGMQWKLSMEHARLSAARLTTASYHEIRYEDFTGDPTGTLDKVSSFCDLEWDRELIAESVSDVESRNYKWRDAFSDDQVRQLNSMLGDLLNELGYETE